MSKNSRQLYSEVNGYDITTKKRFENRFLWAKVEKSGSMGSVLGNHREKQKYDWYRLIHCDGSIHVSLLNVLNEEMLLMFGFLVASSPTYI